MEKSHRRLVLAQADPGAARAPDRDKPDRDKPDRADAELVTLKQQVDEMLDREAIRQLPISYAQYARTKNVDGLVGLYAKDATFDVPENMGTQAGPCCGLEAIREALHAELPRADPWPCVHSHYFEMLGNGCAHGFVYMELRTGVEGLRVSHIGCYQDQYVKEDGVWKFRSRRLCAIPLPVAPAGFDR